MVKENGYYELTLSDGRINHNNIVLTSDDGKLSKTIKIIGTYKDGIIEEMVTGIKLRYVNEVDKICDRRIYKDNEVVEVLPKGEYFTYYSTPCYIDAKKIETKPAIKETQSIRDIPNGMKKYNGIINSIVSSSTNQFNLVKNAEPFTEDMYSIQKYDNIPEIIEEGYYRLALSDGERYHKYINVGLKEEIPIIAEYKDGIMKIIMSDIVLEDISNVIEIQDSRRISLDSSITLLPSGDYHSYFNKPCYYKKQKITSNIDSKTLNLLISNPNLLLVYLNTIKEIIYSTTIGYEIVKDNPYYSCESTKKKKIREENKYKNISEPKKRIKTNYKTKHPRNYYKKKEGIK